MDPQNDKVDAKNDDNKANNDINENTNTGSSTSVQQPKPKKTERNRRPKQKITPEFITTVLQDRYHNGLTVSQVKEKYGIGHEVYKLINSHSEAFISKFGKKKKGISVEDLQKYWENLNIGKEEEAFDDAHQKDSL